MVFNKTLGIYTGHMGIDFAADAGTNVVAVYDGTIESVTTSYLQGTTVTIDHGNGLKSVYNSIEAAENLTEGKAVKKGDVIGAVSDNNRQEYKDGAHLHFEVIENGEKIDPETYLLSSENNPSHKSLTKTHLSSLKSHILKRFPVHCTGDFLCAES